MAGLQWPSGPTAQDPQRLPARRWRTWEEDEGVEDAFKPLSPEQAQAWRRRHAVPWVRRVLLAQALLAVFALAVAAGLQALWVPQRVTLVVSVAWGGACAWLPTGLMAWGMAGGWRGWLRRAQAGGEPRQWLARWLLWEGVKVALTLAMLVAAPRVVPNVDWLGVLAGLVVVLKGYALAWWLPRPR